MTQEFLRFENSEIWIRCRSQVLLSSSEQDSRPHPTPQAGSASLPSQAPVSPSDSFGHPLSPRSLVRPAKCRGATHWSRFVLPKPRPAALQHCHPAQAAPQRCIPEATSSRSWGCHLVHLGDRGSTRRSTPSQVDRQGRFRSSPDRSIVRSRQVEITADCLDETDLRPKQVATKRISYT